MSRRKEKKEKKEKKDKKKKNDKVEDEPQNPKPYVPYWDRERDFIGKVDSKRTQLLQDPSGLNSRFSTGKYL